MESKKKNILIFINPISGKGYSLFTYNSISEKIDLYYNITKIITLYDKHIDDYFKDNVTSINNYDLIVGIGGDGIMYQIINNIKLNCLSNIPIVSEIPCGSGNGFFKSITNEYNLNNDLNTSINIITKYKTSKIDLLHIQNLNKYARLAISWGFISDLDIYTEWMRKLGDIRFILGALWNLLKKNNYAGTLEYLDKDNNWITINNNFIYFWACNVAYGSRDILCAPGAKSNDGLIHISYIVDNVSRYELANIMLSLFQGKHIEHPKVKYISTTNFKLTISSGIITLDGEKIDDKYINVKNMNEELSILV